MKTTPASGGARGALRGGPSPEQTSQLERAPAAAERASARTRGAKLVHDLSGTLATIGLHLHMAATLAPASPIAKHIDASLRALRLSRAQLIKIAESLPDVRPAVSDRRGRKRRSTP